MRFLPFEQHLTWRDAGRLASWLAPYLATWLLLAAPSWLETRLPESVARITSVELVSAVGARPVALDEVILPDGYGLLRVGLHAEEAPPAGVPLALQLAGVFSARATLNGVDIGFKGAPGPTWETEVAGPIDAIIPIPAGLLREGDNELVLDLSSHAIGYPVESIFHSVRGDYGIGIGAYSGDARRPIGQYASPFLMIAVLTLALIAAAMQGAFAKGPGRWEAALVTALLIGALAEISRSFVNYPYPWHGVRMGVLTLTLGAAAYALSMTAASFAGLPRRRELALGAGGLIVLIGTISASFDGRIADMIAVGAALGAGAALWGAIVRRRGCVELTAALMFILGATLLSPNSVFLDGALYASVLPLVALLLLSWRGVAPEVEKSAGLAARVAIGGANRRRYAPLAEIKAVHGAGNYAEFELTSGERVLDERKLADWADSLPSSFFRVHRSHIVNLEHTRAVLTLGAGKYEVEMTDRARIPLSRSRVGPLRALIETTGVLPGAASAE